MGPSGIGKSSLLRPSRAFVQPTDSWKGPGWHWSTTPSLLERKIVRRNPKGGPHPKGDFFSLLVLCYRQNVPLNRSEGSLDFC